MGQSEEKVILYLLGIDKKWIRNESNEWVEYTQEEEAVKLQTSLIEEQEEAIEIISSKKWWQFWIKNKKE
jgi:hypothetical protein